MMAEGATPGLGEMLREKYEELVFNGSRLNEQRWAEMASYTYKLFAPGGPCAAINVARPVPQHIEALIKYGRHNPSCSTGGACTCGFEEVQKQLGLIQ